MADNVVEETCFQLNEEDIVCVEGDCGMEDSTLLKEADQPLCFAAAVQQDFNKIRTQCLAEGRLFEDPEFRAEKSWLRPGDLCDDPKLFVKGFSRFDVNQGNLGNCWLFAAIANLTLNENLFFQVVPTDQSFEKGEYAGVFHFRFWQYGDWVDVVIDDRLPASSYRLEFGHSSEKNEFWCPLLEKAYAKLYGSYEALKGGLISDALVDFTGGVSEIYYLENKMPADFYTILLKAFKNNALMGGGIKADPKNKEATAAAGLVLHHAYSITKVQSVVIERSGNSENIQLIRLRNPWGNASEWKGPWSDNSREWISIPDSEKQKMGLNFDHDGEFWMTYQDFLKHFSFVYICHLTANSLDPESHTKTWQMSVVEGKWIPGENAGGSNNNKNSFWRNPQYIITLTDADDDDGEDKCSVIVSLMQKNRRLKKLANLSIGFALYRLMNKDKTPKPLNQDFFKNNTATVGSNTFYDARESTKRFKLPCGTYVIIPSTFKPAQGGEFLLRVFSENNSNMVKYGENRSDRQL